MENNIKYCIVTIIYNEIINYELNDFYNYFKRLINYENEHSILPSDTVIFEYDDKIEDLNFNQNISNINLENNDIYSFMPSMITINNKINLIKNTPIFENNVYKDKNIGKLLNPISLKKGYKLDSSKYCSSYKLCNDTIFGICKIKYNAINTAKYIIGFDHKLLDYENVKNIFIELIKNKLMY